MRIISRNTVAAFGAVHPETESSLREWVNRTRGERWRTMGDIQAAFPKAKVLNGERVRFEVAGGAYRLIAAVDFERSIVFIKFIGSHAAYDRVDALTVSQF